MSVAMHCSGRNKAVGFSEYKKPMLIASGHVIEYYDFFLYGLLAPIFISQFIPEQHEQLSLIYAYILLAIGFCFRPLGIFIWGHIADKYGRKPVLLTTITLMVIPAIGISILPTYEKIGFIAPVLLIFFRIIQGLAYSGEVPTSVALLYETAPKRNKKVIYCSFLEIGTITGLVLASCITASIATIVNQDQLVVWGWRIPFAISVFFIFILRHIRKALIDTIPDSYSALDYPVLHVIKNKWKETLKICILLAPLSIVFYSYAVFVPGIIKNMFNMTYIESMLLTAALFLYVLIMISVMAILCSRYCLKKILCYAIIGVCISNVISLCVIELQFNYVIICLSLMPVGLFLAVLLGTHLAFITGYAEQNHRVSQTGFIITLSIAIFGGTTPVLNTWLLDYFSSLFPLAIYFITMTIIACIVLYNLPNIKDLQ